MTADWSTLEREAIATLRTAERAFTKMPIYFLDCARLTGSSAASRCAVAWCGLLDDHLLARPHVANYEGGGPVIFFSASAIEREADGPQDVPATFLEIALHEAAHIIDGQDLAAYAAPREVDPLFIALCHREIVQLATAAPTSHHEARYRDLYLEHHSARWIRACCHLKSRVESRLGKLVPMARILRKDFGPRGEFFLHALGNEIERCADWPIARILELPLPPEFTALWERNVQAFYEREAERENARAKEKITLPIPDSSAGADVPPPAVPGDGALSGALPMSVLTYIGSVASLFAKRKQTAEESYRELVRNVAKGRPPAAEVAEQILHDADRTPTSLQSEAELIVQREAWRKIRDSLPAIEQAREKIKAAFTEINTKCERAVQEHESRTFELMAQERALETQARAVTDSEAHLIRTAPEDRKESLKDAEQVTGRLNGELWEARRQLVEAKEIHGRLSPMVQAAAKTYEDGQVIGPNSEWQTLGFPSMEQYAEARRKVQTAAADVERLSADVERLTRELAAAESAIAKCRAAFLEV